MIKPLPSVIIHSLLGRKELSAMNKQELKENLEEQTKDAINILQLLTVELSANEDDEHTIRAVSIVEKILKSNLELLQQLN